MTAFPAKQRAALTKLRVRHPRAQLRVLKRRSDVMRVKLTWPDQSLHNHGHPRLAHAEIEPDGTTTYIIPRKWYR